MAALSWKPIPELVIFGVLITAFYSISRTQGRNAMARHWRTAWFVIYLHYVGLLFVQWPGVVGKLFDVVELSALTWCAVLLTRSLDPRPDRPESRRLFLGLALANLAYFAVLVFEFPDPLRLAAIAAYAAVPLALGQRRTARRQTDRWPLYEAAGYVAMAALLGWAHFYPDSGLGSWALGALPFTGAYLICCTRFALRYRFRTGGAFTTVAGLLLWSMVWVIGALLGTYAPGITVESEVWNLPKFLVAVGMIMLLLEEQSRLSRHLALHDPLTSVANRRLLAEHLAAALERARQRQTRLALLSIDLDGFKQINDRLGHHAGDEVLQRVAALFGAQIREADLLARTGGDEFCVVLEGPIDRADAQRIAQSLSDLLREPLPITGRSVDIRASIGVAIFPEDARTAEALCIRADEQMYEAKLDGHPRSATGPGTSPARVPDPVAAEVGGS